MVALGLRQVFAEGRCILLAAATGLAVFILATWLPNLGLVWQIAASASVPLACPLGAPGKIERCQPSDAQQGRSALSISLEALKSSRGSNRHYKT